MTEKIGDIIVIGIAFLITSLVMSALIMIPPPGFNSAIWESCEDSGVPIVTSNYGDYDCLPSQWDYCKFPEWSGWYKYPDEIRECGLND